MVQNKIYELLDMMSDLSEKCYCAGWLDETEYILWQAIMNGCKKLDWGQDVIEEWELVKLKNLAEAVEGWWIFTKKGDNYFGQAFLKMTDWLDLFEKWQKGELKDV